MPIRKISFHLKTKTNFLIFRENNIDVKSSYTYNKKILKNGSDSSKIKIYCPLAERSYWEMDVTDAEKKLFEHLDSIKPGMYCIYFMGYRFKIKDGHLVDRPYKLNGVSTNFKSVELLIPSCTNTYFNPLKASHPDIWYKHKLCSIARAKHRGAHLTTFSYDTLTINHRFPLYIQKR